MDVTVQQRQTVKEWLAAGASLSDVQKNLKTEFGITLTYMDVRLLVLEIGAEVKDKPEPKPKPQPPAPAAAATETDPYAEEFEDPVIEKIPKEEIAEDTPAPQDTAGSQVTMTLDRLVVPGAMVSGDVTFSDGVKARWLIDQYGRFGLEPEKPGYRPASADLQAFQVQLRLELQRNGYA